MASPSTAPHPDAALGSSTAAMAWALAGYAAFSTSDALIKLLSAELEVAQIAFFVALFAAVPVGLSLWREGGVRALRSSAPGLVLLRGLFITGTSLCAWNAFARLPLADAHALIFTMPLWVTVAAAVLLGETVRWRRATVVVVGFLGILVMLRPGEAALGLGHLFAFATAMFAGAGMLVARVIGSRAGGGLQVAVTNGLVLMLTAPVVLVAPPALDLGTLALLVLAGTVLGSAQLAVLMALRAGSAALVSPFQYSQLLWATLYGVLLFDSFPDAPTLVGAALVITSGLYIMHREQMTGHACARPGCDGSRCGDA